VLGLDFAGDVFGQYGALSVTKLTTLDGGLAIDLIDGFTLAKGDRFDILGFGGLAGPGFDSLALDGAACSSAGVDKWACGSVRLREVIDATSLDLVVAPCLGRTRVGGLVAHSRTLDLGDARAGLPRSRRPGTQGPEESRVELRPSETRSAGASAR
jgi:hypothetical protein